MIADICFWMSMVLSWAVIIMGVCLLGRSEERQTALLESCFGGCVLALVVALGLYLFLPGEAPRAELRQTEITVAGGMSQTGLWAGDGPGGFGR